MTDVFRKKTDALLDKLLAVNPCANIEIYDEDFLKMSYKKRKELVLSSDLIIDGSDNIDTKLKVNGLAYKTRPVIYPCLYDGARGGEIFYSVPNANMPCLVCVFGPIVEQMKDVKRGEQDYTTGRIKSMPGLLADIQVVVARTIKLALGLLTGDKEDSFIEKITEPGCSLLFIGNEKDFFIFDRPFQEIWAETSINPSCSCQTLR